MSGGETSGGEARPEGLAVLYRIANELGIIALRLRQGNEANKTGDLHSAEVVLEEQYEYRVVWTREGIARKRKIYQTEAAARRFIVLLGPEPWRALGKDPDEYWCCEGGDCGCGGLSVRDDSDGKRALMPPLVEQPSIERRTVGAWLPEEAGDED